MIIKKIKEHNLFLARAVLFLVLSYGIIPLILSFLTKGYSAKIEYNFFSFSAYVLMMLILFVIFNRKKILRYSVVPNIRVISVNVLLSIFFFWGYYYLRFRMDYGLESYLFWTILSGVSYILGMFFLAVAIFGWKLFVNTYPTLILFSLITYFFYILTQILNQFWTSLAIGVTYFSNKIISLFVSGTFMEIGKGDPVLGVDNFQVIIGPACSGIESLSMFLGLFLLLMVYEQNNLNYKRAGIVFVLGLIGTYFLNVLRIVLILLIGRKYPIFALGLFHSQAGWILFSLFMLVLLYFGYGWMRKR